MGKWPMKQVVFHRNSLCICVAFWNAQHLSTIGIHLLYQVLIVVGHIMSKA